MLGEFILQAIGLFIATNIDDIIVLSKSKRASGRLLTSCQKILEGRLELQMNTEKSKAISIYSRQFKFLGYAMGKHKGGIYIRAHKKSLAKAKRKLKSFVRKILAMYIMPKRKWRRI